MAKNDARAEGGNSQGTQATENALAQSTASRGRARVVSHHCRKLRTPLDHRSNSTTHGRFRERAVANATIPVRIDSRLVCLAQPLSPARRCRRYLGCDSRTRQATRSILARLERCGQPTRASMLVQGRRKKHSVWTPSLGHAELHPQQSGSSRLRWPLARLAIFQCRAFSGGSRTPGGRANLA